MQTSNFSTFMILNFLSVFFERSDLLKIIMCANDYSNEFNKIWCELYIDAGGIVE